MPKVLEAFEIDTANEEVDLQMTRAEEEATQRAFSPISHSQQVQDLSDGGMVNGMRVTPMRDGRKITKGRAAVRRAWMWNGTESMLPLGWNPEGTRHDGARPYLLKRHCLCCHVAGFRGPQCPACVKNNCLKCASSTDTWTEQVAMNGRVIRGYIIANFYLSKEQVPFPTNFYGSIDCFLPMCQRRGSLGFLTEDAMRIHAGFKHRFEYRAHLEAEQSSRTSEIDTLKQQINALMLERVQEKAPVLAGGAPDAPMYVSAKRRSAKQLAADRRMRRKPVRQ